MRTSVLYSALVFAFAVSAVAEPPIKLDCTIRYWNEAFKKEKEHDYETGYSTTKVAPKDIAWLRPGESPIDRRTGGVPRTFGFVVLGSCRKGNLTDSTDLPDLLIKLSKLASDHGANAISYEKSGTEIRFQFLRIKDAILNAPRPQVPARLTGRTPTEADVTVAPEVRGIMLSMPRPTYPVEAPNRHITGRGMCEILIVPKTGIVTHVTVLQSTGSKVLDDAAVNAFSRWRARPGKVSRIRVPFTFTFAT
jgi:TonB family protein